MTSHFPTPYPDEILYSLCGRYSDRVQYSNRTSVAEELFGSTKISAVLDLPSYLTYFSASLPAGHRLTTDVLINEHTLLPFYGPFLPSARYRNIKEAMTGSDARIVKMLAGKSIGTVKTTNTIRFCPTCVEEDRRTYGECYWHRLQQIPGVSVCPTHLVFLEESAVRVRYRAGIEGYISAERAATFLTPRPLELSSPHHRTLIQVARDAAWLLNQHDLNPGFEVLHACYMHVLTEEGLAVGRSSRGRRVRVNDVIKKLRQKFTTQLLEELQSDFDESKTSNWPARLVKSLLGAYSLHPLRHILFIQNLGHTAESFFERCAAIQTSIDDFKHPKLTFGTGPWPCLNQASDHFQERLITQCNVVYSPYRKALMGTFSCTCGFIYTKKELKNSADTSIMQFRIKQFGPVWENLLQTLWEDASISVTQAARRLGVQWNTVTRHAARLGLKFPRVSYTHRTVSANIDLQERFKKVEAEKEKKLNNYRKQWLLGVKAHPGASRWIFKQRILPAIHCWLSKHDRSWLQAHLPPLRKRVGPRRPTDWENRDIALADEVRRAAVQIKTKEGRPARVSKTALYLALRSHLVNNTAALRKLPLTSLALSEVVESHNDFAIRRAWWAATCLAEENISPTWGRFLDRIRVSQNILSVPEVRREVIAAWQSLRPSEVCNITNLAA